MTDRPQRFTEGFETASHEQWLEVVRAGLDGASFDRKLRTPTPEGITTEPLYSADSVHGLSETGFWPGLPPYTRGSHPVGRSRQGWDLRVEIAVRDPESTRARIRQALDGGAESLVLQLSSDESAGLKSLESLLESIDRARTPVYLEGAGAGFARAAALLALSRRKNASGGSGVDPLAALAREGSLAGGLDRQLDLMVALAKQCLEKAAGLRVVEISTRPYAEGGANAVQEIACALATGAEYLRAFDRAGLEPASMARQVWLSMGIGRDLFMEVAKIRVMRRTWARLMQACGGEGQDQTVTINLHSLQRRRTRRDPWVNLLRATAEGFLVAVSGADSATIQPFDELLGPSDPAAERMARTNQIILREEAHLHRVVDPAGGSWYVESLSQELAERAWAEFQKIETQGGMGAALVTGGIAREIAENAAAVQNEIARRKRPITGVSSFANLDEQPLERPAGSPAPPSGQAVSPESLPELRGASADAAVDAASAALLSGAAFDTVEAALASVGAPTAGHLVQPVREAEIFESLRDASQAACPEPTVFLANLGSIPQYKARAAFASGVFAAGGIRAIDRGGFEDPGVCAAAWSDSGAPIAVICSSDRIYGERAAEVAESLKRAGARRIYLAGRPGEREAADRAAGVDGFLYLGCDVHQLLVNALECLGVIS